MNLSYILSVLSLISFMNMSQAMFPSFGSDFINSEDTLFCDECRCMKLSAEMAYFQDANVCLECFVKVLNESGENSVPSPQHPSPQPTYHQQSRSPSPELHSVQPESQNNDNIAQQFATNGFVETQQQIYCSVNRKALVLLAVVAAAGVYYTGKKIYNKLRKRPVLASPIINTSDLTSSNEE